MRNEGCRKLMIKYINEHEADQPISAAKVAEYVANETGIDKAIVKKTVNVNMSRLEKANELMRVEKGIYCKVIKTPFGNYSPNKEVLFCKHLMYDGDDVIGYETGLSMMNRLGLTSQIPKRRCIATNLYTKRAAADIQVEIKKPPATVTKANYRYFQILDAIKYLAVVPVNVENPENVLRSAVRAFGLDADMIIYMARKLYDQKTLLKTIDIVLGGRYESAQG